MSNFYEGMKPYSSLPAVLLPPGQRLIWRSDKLSYGEILITVDEVDKWDTVFHVTVKSLGAFITFDFDTVVVEIPQEPLEVKLQTLMQALQYKVLETHKNDYFRFQQSGGHVS